MKELSKKQKQLLSQLVLKRMTSLSLDIMEYQRSEITDSAKGILVAAAKEEHRQLSEIGTMLEEK